MLGSAALDLQAVDGIVCTVKGAGVGSALAADGRPFVTIGDGDVVHQLRADRSVLAVEFRMGLVPVDQSREPEQLACVGNFVDIRILLGRLVLTTYGAEAVFTVRMLRVSDGVGIFAADFAIAEIFRVDNFVAAVQHRERIHRAVVQVLTPDVGIAGVGAVEQVSHFTGGELAGRLYVARRIADLGAHQFRVRIAVVTVPIKVPVFASFWLSPTRCPIRLWPVMVLPYSKQLTILPP